ncbi:MAG: hypothetical protein RI932_403 [Pseudomonadota bacterium]|jgi:hypothetical protein
MKHVAVLSVDHTKARFYLLTPAERPNEQWSPILHPLDEIINVHWLEQEKEILTGGNRHSYHVGMCGNANTNHGFDDHLGSHKVEIDKRFSREITTRLRKFLTENPADRLLIAAESKVLGRLREQMGEEFRLKMVVEEVNTNLCNFKPVPLHEHLAKLGHLPARMAPQNPQQESFARSGQWRRRRIPAEGKEPGELGAQPQ